EPCDKVTNVDQRLSRHDAHAPVARRMRDADPEKKASAGSLLDKRGALREILNGAGIDRRDRRAEKNALRGETQRRTLRHIAEHARPVEAAEATPLGLARQVEGQSPP